MMSNRAPPSQQNSGTFVTFRLRPRPHAFANMTKINVDQAVRERYSSAASYRETALCCPVDYDAKYLEAIPAEVIERDYGCGDPSKYVREGEVVLDLGCGGGKICFIAAQVVGPAGEVIGVDMNDDMLALARNSQPVVAHKIGFDNVTFLKGKIQDLALDRDEVDEYLKANPIRSEADFQRLEATINELRATSPMIPDQSIDVVVSNCVLNLVDAAEKEQLFREIFRVLRVGGRAVISDIVSDEPVPEALQNDPELWSGCVSGAFELQEFLLAFEQAGFHGITLESLQREPWQTVEDIEFRSATVIAYKGEDLEPASEDDEPVASVVYRGPFARIQDERGHTFERGESTFVTRLTLETLSREPFAEHFDFGSVDFDGEDDDVSPHPSAKLNLPTMGCNTPGCC